MEQPIPDADKLYSQNLTLVLNFFASKLQLYYSSSRLTLLLTLLSASETNDMRTYSVPLPSRLKLIDADALGLHTTRGHFLEECSWRIFQDFLHSSEPLALDQRRYAIASLACLKILFGHYQAPVLRVTWFSRHSRTLRVDMEHHSQRHHGDHADLPAGTDWERSIHLYWDLRFHLANQMRQGTHHSRLNTPVAVSRRLEGGYQYLRSTHLQFLLQKSAYSDKILDFARYRVFRSAYLARQHPLYMKKAIFALAKYIQRVTGETAEVRTCESIWGRDGLFAQAV